MSEWKEHIGIVKRGYDDETIDVVCAGIHDGAVLEGIHRESASPLKWRPRRGDEVVLRQRPIPLHTDRSVTWVGWAHDPMKPYQNPPWAAGGKVGLASEEQGTCLVLQDDNDSGLNSNGPISRFGSADADEPMLCGNLYRTHHAATLDRIAEALEGIRTLLQARDLQVSVEQAASVALATALTAAVPAGAIDWAAWQAAITAVNEAHQTAIGTARSTLATAKAALVTGGSSQKETIGGHLSNYTFTSKAPSGVLLPPPDDGDD